jgi:hypothetical protein
MAMTLVAWQRLPDFFARHFDDVRTFFFDPCWLTTAWVFALACTIYLLLLAALRGVGFAFRLVRR